MNQASSGAFLSSPTQDPKRDADLSIGRASDLISTNGRANMTASLIANDRSNEERDEEDKEPSHDFHTLCRRDSHYHDTVVELAGPMRQKDPLYNLLLVLGLANCLCSALALFLPYSFSVYKRLPNNSERWERYGLFDSMPCSKYKSGEAGKADICYGGNEIVGTWVLLMQIFGVVGLIQCVLGFAMQAINLLLKQRNKTLHDASLLATGLACFFTMVAGQIGHNHAVWSDSVDLRGTDMVDAEPLGSALFLSCVVLSGWSCVFLHVTQHAPGPLSKDTRFLHTLVSEKALDVGTPAQPVFIQQEPFEVEDENMIEEGFGADTLSLHSTSL